MSSRILGNVWDACAAHDIKGAKLLIMARLADYSNDDGMSYPSVETICRQLGLGESTVRSAISDLEAAGWLSREFRRRGNRNSSNKYYLNAERLETYARTEKDKVKALKEEQRNRDGFHPPESEGSEGFHPPESEGSEGFHPPESGKNGVFTPQNLAPDPQVNSKHDPQVNSKHDPQVNSKHDPQEARQKKPSFEPSKLKPKNVSEEIWKDWIKFRREVRKPLTQTTCQYQARQLESHQNPDEVIRMSITNGWQGLFPDRVANNPVRKERDYSHLSEEQRRKVELFEFMYGTGE